MSPPPDGVANEKLPYEGMEVVAIPPPPEPTEPPPQHDDKRTTLSTAAAFESSPRTMLAISESMEQVEMITPPRPVYDVRKKVNNAAAAGGTKQQRHHRQSSTVSSKSYNSSSNTSNGSGNNKDAAITTTAKNKAGKKPKNKMSYLQMAKLGYQELVHAVIRPPRSNYPLDALGAQKFRFCGKHFERKDFGVVNDRGLLIECSMWQRAQEEGEGEHPEEENEESFERQESELTDATPVRGKIQFIPQSRSNSSSNSNDSSVDSVEKGQLLYVTIPDSNETDDTALSTPSNQQPNDNNDGPHRSSVFSPKSKPSASSCRPLERQPVVIYLHGNSSSRTEVIPQLGHLLALGLAVVAFDFCGSGHSEGDFVSLGYYEREDLQTVINHLRASGTVSSIALWGRSMGAATALMYGSRDPTISCLILDSPFIDLATLATELVERGKEHGVHVPQIVVSMVMRMLKSSVKQEAGFNIKHISPVCHAPKCFIPAMIVAGEHDDFIKKSHAEVIHRVYAGYKNLVIVDGDHNSPRPRYMVQGAMLFLQSCMKVSASLELVVPLNTSLTAPPWLSPENMGRLSATLKQKTALGGGRLWLPVENTRQSSQGRKKQHQLPHPPSLNDEDGTCFSRDVSPRKGFRQNHVASYDATGATLPDMSKRQAEIQSSLFKMLGEDELALG